MADHTIFVLLDTNRKEPLSFTPNLVRLSEPGWIVFRRTFGETFLFNELPPLPPGWQQELADDGAALYIYDPYDLNSVTTQWKVPITVRRGGVEYSAPLGDGDPPIIRNEG
jgi:hypothetical protein